MTCIAEKALRGARLDDLLIIDCHTHIGLYPNFHIPDGSAEGMIKVMDHVGIDRVCATAIVSCGPDYEYGNNMILDTLNRYPDRFIGYVTVYPHESAGSMLRELDRCFAHPGMKAIKLHPYSHGLPIDDPRYRAAYETAEARNCPVLIHVWGKGDVHAIAKVAARFPNANLIMGHAGAEIRAMEEAIEVVKQFDNVYADLALSYAYEGNVEWLVREMGAHKVLYGSDMPFFDPRPTFGRVALAHISDDEKRAVFGLNMKRLLK